MNNSDARKTSALLFLDGDNFKYINDTWGKSDGAGGVYDAGHVE
ncbi:hypothetical protein HMPREF0774_2065 [Staphylococcus aureus subsp. aureus TCH130]|nr:hypothetical protein HMPREF0774_2065 [Staphylococcus aureus subsp. aureus TCH130]